MGMFRYVKQHVSVSKSPLLVPIAVYINGNKSVLFLHKNEQKGSRITDELSSLGTRG